jgi:hypothetical protein
MLAFALFVLLFGCAIAAALAVKVIRLASRAHRDIERYIKS